MVTNDIGTKVTIREKFAESDTLRDGTVVGLSLWTDQSGTMTGQRLIELADGNRLYYESWMFTTNTEAAMVSPTSPDLTQLELVAIEYYDRGIPSALPNGNPFKGYAENHRWGYHGANNNRNCPVCIRNRGK